MITLHGFPFSNYHNIVKHALMVKGIDFEEHLVYPWDAALLEANPLGKVPAMTTGQGQHLSESSVLLDYLEDAYPEPALLPPDPAERAAVRRLTRIAELYFDLPARRLLPAVLGNAEAPPELLDEVRGGLQRGVTGMTQLARFDPFLAGSGLSVADLYLRYALVIPRLVGPSLLDWDVVAAVPGLSQWDDMMADTDIARKIDADQAANRDEFMGHLASRA
jgi:glutathione S-transferase